MNIPFEDNPWSVEDASAFLKYCCPECEFQILNYQKFYDHATENHEKSMILFGTESFDIGFNDEMVEQCDKLQKDENLILFTEDQDLTDKSDNNENESILSNEDEDPTDKSDDNGNKSTDINNAPIKSRPFDCKFCDRKCDHISELFHHSADQHASEIPQVFKCNYCEFFRKKKILVEYHSLGAHDKHFKCTACDKQLKKDENLEDHFKISSLCQNVNKTKKNYKICRECKKIFSSVIRYNKHNTKVKLVFRELHHFPNSVQDT